jgi:hypothetical protein
MDSGVFSAIHRHSAVGPNCESPCTCLFILPILVTGYRFYNHLPSAIFFWMGIRAWLRELNGVGGKALVSIWLKLPRMLWVLFKAELLLPGRCAYL